MKKIFILILILLFVFAFIRVTTSTYENIKRRNNAESMPVTDFKIITGFLFLT